MLGLAWAGTFLLPLLAFRGDYLDYLWPKRSSWYEGASVAGCKDITVLLSPVSSGWRCIKIYDDSMGEKKTLSTCRNSLGHLEAPYWMSRPPKLSTHLHLSWWDRVNAFSFLSISISGEIWSQGAMGRSSGGLCRRSALWERQAAGEEGLPSSSDGVWCDLSRVISIRENPDAYRK